MQKLLFIHMGNVSYTNVRVIEQLQDKFADYDVDTLDVVPLFRQHRLAFALNVPLVFREYGNFGRGWAKFSSTAYGSRKIREWVNQHVRDNDYRFTIQTQSLYDASTPGVPHYVYTDHTALTNLYYPAFNKLDLRPKTFLQREASIYRNATLVFTFSNHVKKSLIELYHCHPNKVQRVGGGANVKVTDISPADKDYANKNIVFVGVDWERKGGPDLLEAFKIVYEQHPDATLTIVGSTPDIDHPGVNVVGRVPSEQVGAYYHRASIFAMPTKREPFGIVFVEAMHNFLPIVATNIGAVPDLVHDGKSGFTVPTGDVNALAEAVSTLLADPVLCRTFGEYGHNLAREYTWDAVGHRIHDHIIDTL